MRAIVHAATAALFSLFLANTAIAAGEPQSNVKVTLLDMTVMHGGASGSSGPGMKGPGRGMTGRGMMAIRTSVSSVKAGKVVFDVSNLSRSLEHEMVVIAVNRPDARLPYDSKRQRVIEKDVKVMGETEDMKPESSKTIALTLPAGNYMLVCNIPGHYAAGMVAPFTVTP
jgi:uncharacterized cupredoxin-like copper-binding protein